MSLLTIIQDAALELGITSPSVAIASTDLQVKQLVALAKKEGYELSGRLNWQNLIREGSFTTVATSLQSTLAAACQESASATAYKPDFDRYINESMWNRTSSWPVRGPLDTLEWQERQAAGTNAGIGNFFRIRANSIYFYPTPTAGDSIYFEYVSKNWCESAAAAGQSTWLADDDVSRLDEEIMRLGVMWRFLKSKGLDYGEAYKTYESAVSDAWGSDGGRDVIDMTGDITQNLTLTIPEGSWSS